MKNINNPDNNSSKLVTVIIPTYCAENHIHRCLSSIKNQTYKHIEIIVVDQSSPDRTREIAKNFSDKVMLVEKPLFYSPPSSSRNIGAKASQGSYLLNIDADMELSPTLIADCVNQIESQGYVALIIHEDDIASNFWARCRAFEKGLMIKDPYMEAARFVLKNAFDKINGYDTTLGSGEDWDLHARLKQIGTIGYAQPKIKHHTGKKYLLPNFKRMINYGRTFDAYIKKHPELSKKQLTPFREMYFRKWKQFFIHPTLSFGLAILKFTEFLAAYIGLIYNRTQQKKQGQHIGVRI